MLRVNLDDVDAVRRGDPHGMLDLMAPYVDRFQSAHEGVLRAPFELATDPRNAVLAGMGGSGISADVAASLVHTAGRVPVVPVKGYRLPRWAGADTLVVATSYSGGTEETLAVAQEAVDRGARLVTIASGGDLARLGRDAGVAHVDVEGGKPPRVALPELLGSLLGVLHAADVLRVPVDESTLDAARRLHEAVGPDAPQGRNPAKTVAAALHDRLPVLYATPGLAPAALRGRCQLNENAKMIAREDTLPEGNHNDLVAWAALEEGDPYFVTFLRERDEPAPVAARFDHFTTVLHRAGVGNGAFFADAPSRLGRLLEALIFVDYVSVYAGLLRGVDPTPVDAISELKSTLARRAAPTH